MNRNNKILGGPLVEVFCAVFDGRTCSMKGFEKVVIFIIRFFMKFGKFEKTFKFRKKLKIKRYKKL